MNYYKFIDEKYYIYSYKMYTSHVVCVCGCVCVHKFSNRKKQVILETGSEISFG